MGCLLDHRDAQSTTQRQEHYSGNCGGRRPDLALAYLCSWTVTLANAAPVDLSWGWLVNLPEEVWQLFNSILEAAASSLHWASVILLVVLLIGGYFIYKKIASNEALVARLLNMIEELIGKNKE